MTFLVVALMATAVVPTAGQGVPPLPTDWPVWLVGGGGVDGTRLSPYEGARFAVGGTDKETPLEVGEAIEPRAVRTMALRAERRDGRDVWVRSFEVSRAGESEVLVTGEIVLDRKSLAPLSSAMTQGGNTRGFEYDWRTYEVRSSDGSVEKADLMTLEAAAHETWIAAIDWSSGTRALIPAILAGGGGKWWAAPRVAGEEDVDLGDGRLHRAWVIELDWWGMGADHETFTAGGGVNGSGGPGGKYWVLQDAPAGVPSVVRIQTEVDGSTDSVVQMQELTGG